MESLDYDPAELEEAITGFLRREAYNFLAAWCNYCNGVRWGAHDCTEKPKRKIVWPADPPNVKMGLVACKLCKRKNRHYHDEDEWLAA